MQWPFKKKALNNVPINTGSYWPFAVKEWDTGYWQRNIEYERKDVLCYHAVFACITLIASDVSKLLPMMMAKDSNDIWTEVPYGDYEVVNKPNSYQNRIQFYESWVLSKFIRGNAYILKVRDANRKVVEMHVLHPDRVLPLVSDDGQVFYQLSQDNLAGLDPLGVTVPASEIIHDRFNCFFHPLVGLSPLFASGLPAYMGIKILENSSKLFANGARPSGILTVPEAISAENAAAMRQQWEANYGGENYGKTAILGGDVKYSAISMKAEEAQLVEQLKMTAEMVCSTFHVPPYKIGLGQMPSYNNVEALNLEYYNSALQNPIEAIELALDEGLNIPQGRGVEFDLDGLLRMDSKTQIETLATAVKGSIMPVNHALKKINIKPVEGGDYIWMQQQNYSLQALAKRDASPDPFNTASAAPSNDVEEDEESLPMSISETEADITREFLAEFTKGLIHAA